ncbi:MAG: tyrosine-type recombinase/integrase [Solirubrobacteraceae bacterium]
MASVERRSGKRGDVYVVRFRDDQGRQRSKSFGSYVDAVKYGNQTQFRLDTGDWIDPQKGREKFGSFHERWVEARVVSPSRSATEASQAKNHILPTWQNVSLSKIRPLDVDRWIKHLDVGTTTKAMVLAQFKLCLKAAVREGLIRSNPAADTKAPAVRRKRVTSTDVLDAHEVDLLVKATPDDWKALVYLSAWLGWRWSEAMGLRWRDVDLEARVIYVGNETVVEAQGRLHVHDGGKTNASTRIVPLPDMAVSVLKWHRDRAAVDRTGNRRVFLTAPCPPAGRHASAGRKGGCEIEGTCHGHTPFRSNFRRIFIQAVKDAGLEGRCINMRQLRHTAASLMLSNGLDVLDVQDRLGHSRGSVTLDIYGRVLTGRRNASTERLNAAMESVSDLSFASA